MDSYEFRTFHTMKQKEITPPIETGVGPREGLKSQWEVYQWGIREKHMPIFHDAVVELLSKADIYDVNCGSGWAKFKTQKDQDEFEAALFRMI